MDAHRRACSGDVASALDRNAMALLICNDIQLAALQTTGRWRPGEASSRPEGKKNWGNAAAISAPLDPSLRIHADSMS